MQTILISAYAISPLKGSEYGVGWNFVSRLSETFKVIVLYGTSGDSIGDTEELELYLKNHKLSNVEFIKVPPKGAVLFFDRLNHLGINLFFYVAYRLWQRSVFSVAQNIVKEREIYLVHQLNTIGFSSPGYLWKLKRPFVWGPVGGTFCTPSFLMGVLNLKDKIKYGLRNANIRYMLNNSTSLKHVINRADGVFVATVEEQKNFYEYFKKKFPIISENNISEIHNKSMNIDVQNPVKLIWIGRIDGGKALKILLNALSSLDANLNWKLEIIGDGPLRSALQERIIEPKLLEKITWHGWLTRADSIQYLRTADLHILTSIKDSNPTVILESIENGIPTIALDHSGMSSMIKNDQGIKLAIQEVNKIQESLAENLITLIKQPEKIVEMKKNIQKFQQHPTWSKAINETINIYTKAVANYHGKN